jgi:hypothetical protein
MSLARAKIFLYEFNEYEINCYYNFDGISNCYLYAIVVHLLNQQMRDGRELPFCYTIFFFNFTLFPWAYNAILRKKSTDFE